MPRLAVSACAVLLTVAPFGLSSAHAADVTDTTIPQSPDSTYVYDLEKEPSDCIGFLPKPGCGKKPQQAGDRGGSLQYLTFGIMILGVGTVGTVLARNVMKRDREIAERLKDSES
ncbi:MAG: hypothetical protein RLZ67_690 [Actinomycetota bacterium]|jgi:hypothetical protein